MAAEAAVLSHISRASTDIHGLAKFYKEILGFVEIESPKLDFNIIWLSLPPSHAVQIHLVDKNPDVKLQEGPWRSSEAGTDDPRFISRGHHICFSVANFDSFVQTLKKKGIKTHEKSQLFSGVKQVFFFDPDGNGIEIASRPSPSPLNLAIVRDSWASERRNDASEGSQSGQVYASTQKPAK